MTTKQLLASATPHAMQYIQKVVNSNNKVDYEKLKKLFTERKFEAKSFEDTEMEILTFGWQDLERDRNWWWQIQALPFLNWFVNSFALQSDDEKNHYYSLCRDAIHCWTEKAQRNDRSPLVWHDHAAAFRVRNLSNWLLFCHFSGLPISDDAKAESLADLVTEHLEWLTSDKHYSKHTNHGFDQAMIALTISLVFGRKEFESYRQLNRHRLNDELVFAFTDEGVHKENSPGYQKMMLVRLKQLRILALLRETDISALGELYIDKAEGFLKALTMPNGYLPMIGDTRGGDEGLKYEQQNEIDILDYSSSGYVIVRGKVLEKELHLVFKASHFSHYHRHDDDLSIHLYYDGRVLLGDGGLGSHNEKDKKRILLRSSLSHNVPFISNKIPVRTVKELQGKFPKMSVANKTIVGESYSYGELIQRKVDLSRLLMGRITIIDEVIGGGGVNLESNFYSGLGLFDSNGDLLAPIDKSYALKVSPKEKCKVKKNTTYLSPKFGNFIETSCFSFIVDKAKNKTGKIEIELDLQYTQKVLHETMYRGFGPIQIKEAGIWLFDNDYPGNVCHHIMSLRWLGEVKLLETKKKIIRSFISYHQSAEQGKSKYYLGKEADHTTSIRLGVLLNLLKNDVADTALIENIRAEISRSIISCLKETYKENNNHGLMVDTAILNCLVEDDFLRQKHQPDVDFVIGRLQKQLDWIFDEEGYCKEHSTSYQEYNLGIALDLMKVMKKGLGLGFEEKIYEVERRLERVKDASRKALGFLLKDDGTYVTVGDSFPDPKPEILSKAYGSRIPKDALYPESAKGGSFSNKTLGVSVYRSNGIHLVINASWHSYVHKQNDDLSVYFRLNGEDVFIEGGYSDIVDREDVDTRSEYSHSTIIPVGYSWLNRSHVRFGSSCVQDPEIDESNGRIRFYGMHTRVKGMEIKRMIEIEEDKKTIKLFDKSSSSVKLLHRFIIPMNFNISVCGNSVKIISKSNELSLTSRFDRVGGNPAWRLSHIKIIQSNEERESYALDYISDGEATFELIYL